MPAGRHFTRIDTLEIKYEIVRKLGRSRAEKYFKLLSDFLIFGKISKCEFDKLCIGTLGRENVRLHNHLLISINKNACLSKTPPPKESKEAALSVKVTNGYQRSCLQSLCKDFPQSPRKGRTPNLRDRRSKDRPSPLGPHGKSHRTACEDSVAKIQEQSPTELHSLGSRPPGSVEDGEEVDQAAGSPSIHSWSPVKAPLGIPTNTKAMRKVLCSGSGLAYSSQTCHNRGELPDTSFLKKRLEQKLATEGLKISVDGANLLNNALDVFLKGLMKPCLELASARPGQSFRDLGQGCSFPVKNGMWPLSYAQRPSGSISASLLDFRIAMELNPLILGEDWPIQLEKICLRASEGQASID